MKTHKGLTPVPLPMTTSTIIEEFMQRHYPELVENRKRKARKKLAELEMERHAEQNHVSHDLKKLPISHIRDAAEALNQAERINVQGRSMMDFLLEEVKRGKHEAYVVLCQDCKHRGKLYECPMRHIESSEGGGTRVVDATKDEGYCDRGCRDVGH